MAVEIPLDAALLRYDVRLAVEGVALVLGLSWRERVRSWYLDVYDGDGDAIALGRRLVTGWSPLLRTTDDRLAGAAWLLVRVGDGDEDPGVSELGGAVVLLVMSADEVAALGETTNPATPARVVIEEAP